MISIIVCSRSINLFEALSKNINETIGIQYEIIKIENSSASLSISAAYNKGAGESNYPFLCFLHEDVKFDTGNWGEKLISHFSSDGDIGLIGISGGIYKKRMFSGLGEFETDEINIKRINIIQHFKLSSDPICHVLENPYNEIRAQVVSLDGVFLCTKQEIWRGNKFDQKLLKGFHGYDLDFSLQIGRQKKLFVVYDILLEHFSEGRCDMAWETDIIAVHNKWREILPVAVDLSIATGIDIYNKDWDKVWRTVMQWIQSGCSYAQIFKLYNSLFWLINYKNKRHAIIKDFWMQWYKISKLYFGKKQNL